MRYVIIGNGVAGVTAAESIRKLDRSAAITILAEEPHHFYSRIRLIDYLAGVLPDSEALLLKKPDWYERESITVCLSCPALRFDAAQKKVHGGDGREFAYDKLLIAAGARPFVPAVPGIGQAGVFSLRALDDAKAIRQAAAGGRHVLLLGGGILSLEAAFALAQTGCRITVVEPFARLLPRQMDKSGSVILQGIFERQGMRFFLGAQPREIAGSGRVEGVSLDGGTFIRCDMVLVGAGVRPDLRLAQASGMEATRGIVVNDRMETGIPDVYAAGDVAVHHDITYGIWPAAMAQGRVAGTNMAGGDEAFTGMVMTNTLKVAGVNLFAVGDIDGEGLLDAAVFSAPDKGVYKKLVIREGRAAGAILLGDLSGRQKVQQAVQEARRIGEAERNLLEKGDFSLLGVN